jgi:murein DD-endopeptidase MepM/ murein hydrolase activator NlpD
MGKQKKWTILLAVVMVFSLLLPVGADDDLEESQQRLQQLNRQLQQQRLEVYNRTQQAKTVTGEIVQLEQNVERIEQELAQLEKDISVLGAQIEESNKEITIKQQELNRKIELLGERLCFVYEQGDADYLAVLLDATSMRDFLTRYDMINSIIDNDQEMISEVVQQKEELEEQKQKLEEQKAAVEKNQQTQIIKKEELSTTRANRATALAAINADKDRYEQAVNELESESRQLEQIIRSIQGAGGAAQGSGTFIYPTDSRTITSPYGMRYHPILKQNKLHTGTDFAAGMGANMYAADSGTVIFAGWQNAYGQTIIIDHGNGISTLYAHQSQLLVSTDQQVMQGDIIGKVGSTGWSTGPHAHFEIRINGSTVDPMGYL